MDLLHFELKHIQDTCLYWYGKLGAPDGDCRNLWKISALVTAGRLTQAQVASAVEGVRMCHPSNRLAYFYTTLSNALTLLGRDLKAECANVRTEPQCPKAPPKLPTYSKELRKVCTSMAPPEEGRNYEFTDVELDRRNRALIAQLVAAETGNSR